MFRHQEAAEGATRARVGGVKGGGPGRGLGADGDPAGPVGEVASAAARTSGCRRRIRARAVAACRSSFVLLTPRTPRRVPLTGDAGGCVGE